MMISLRTSIRPKVLLGTRGTHQPLAVQTADVFTVMQFPLAIPTMLLVGIQPVINGNTPDVPHLHRDAYCLASIFIDRDLLLDTFLLHGSLDGSAKRPPVTYHYPTVFFAKHVVTSLNDSIKRTPEGVLETTGPITTTESAWGSG
jgi:hypothetical protein